MRTAALLLLLAACSSSRRAAPAEPKQGPPVLDARRGWGSFPLKGAAAPSTLAELSGQMRAAYDERLRMPEGADPIRLSGDSLGSLEELRVDASGAEVRPEFVFRPVARKAKVERTLRVRALEYRAEPLLVDGAAFRTVLTARDADLELVRDAAGTSSLLLAGAAEGSGLLEATAEDLPRAFGSSIGRRARLFGGRADSVRIDLRSDAPNRIAWTIDFEGAWLLLPVKLRISGRMEVDEAFRALFRDVEVRGDNFGGGIAAVFFGGRFTRMGERRYPLLLFKDPGTKVRSFECDTSKGLRMRVTFGRGE